jgi:hypothetical protein
MNNDSVRIIAIVIAALVLAGLVYYYYINVPKKNEHFSSPYPTSDQMIDHSAISSTDRVSPNASRSSNTSRVTRQYDPSAFEPIPMEPHANEYYLPPPRTVESSPSYKPSPGAPNSNFPQDRIEPKDLLPKDASNTKWAQANPAGQGDVRDINLLNAGFHLGMNTQGTSLRNASHDLRSEPSNPRYKVSIWNNATIESDLNRRPLE